MVDSIISMAVCKGVDLEAVLVAWGADLVPWVVDLVDLMVSSITSMEEAWVGVCRGVDLAGGVLADSSQIICQSELVLVCSRVLSDIELYYVSEEQCAVYVSSW